MDVLTETDRDYWCGVLSEGGSTAIPRWSVDPAPGLIPEPVEGRDLRTSTCAVPSLSKGSAQVAMYDAAIPEDLVAASRRRADELNVPFSSMLLAAHAKVLAALSGERNVAAGYVGGTDPGPLPCRLTTEAESWRELLLDTHRVEAQLLSHADFPLDALRRELGVTVPASRLSST